MLDDTIFGSSVEAVGLFYFCFFDSFNSRIVLELFKIPNPRGTIGLNHALANVRFVPSHTRSLCHFMQFTVGFMFTPTHKFIDECEGVS
jgi:hypothetical protein